MGDVIPMHNDDADDDDENRPAAEPSQIKSGRSKLDAMLKKYCIVQVGKDAPIAFWKDEMSPGGGIGPVMQLMLVGAFNTYHADKYMTIEYDKGHSKSVLVSKEFLKHARRYDGLVYEPGKASIVNNRLNMWQGFGIQPREGSWGLIKLHIEDVLAGGHDDQARYIIKWLAWAFQNPGTQAEVALVFQGGKGTGKGMFARAFLGIFGSHGIHISNPEHLVGKHNKHLQHCSALFVDEAFWAGDKKNEGTLKRTITEPTLQIEPKGIDAFSVKNCLHVIIAGNDEWVVPATEGERRYACMDMSEHRQGDMGYFKNLSAEIEGSGLSAMLFELSKMDLRGWHPREDVPQTDALQRQKTRTIQGVDALVQYLCHDALMPCRSGKNPNRAAMNGHPIEGGLLRWAKSNNFKGMFHMAPNTFKEELIERWGCVPCKVGTGTGLAFPPLGELRERFEKRYGKQPSGWRRGHLLEWDDGNEDPEPGQEPESTSVVT